MLDQNTDRMWYVIGALVVGAGVILLANKTMPDVFAKVSETYKKVSESRISAVKTIQVKHPDDNYTDDGYFTWRLNEDGKTVMINDYAEDGPKAVVIPAVIEDMPVTDIAHGAFDNSQITSVVIPSTVTEIGRVAFRDNQLTSVIIPEGVTRIGDSAFGRNKLREVVIPKNVTSIGSWAFSYNNLQKITFPDALETIDGSAFRFNDLTSVSLAANTEITINSFDSRVQINRR